METIVLKNNSLTKNYIFNLISQILTIITPLITTPYVSRILGANGIGEYSYVYSFVMYFSMFGMLGLATYGQLQIAKVRDNKIKLFHTFWEIYAAQCVSMFISLVLYLFFILTLQISYKKMFFVLTLALISQLLDITWFFQGLEDFKNIVKKNIMIKITSTILIFLLVKSKDNLYLYVAILHGATFLGNLALWNYIFNNISFTTIKNLKFWRHWSGSIIFFIPTIASSIYTILDKSMLGIITNSTAQSGYYEQAHKMEQVFAMIVTSLSSVMLPRIAYLSSKDDKNQIEQIQKNSIQFTLLISFPISFGLIGISPTLIPVFWGMDMKHAYLFYKYLAY